MGRTGSLPRGTVTFVFTDIEGSTRLLRSLGDDGYRTVLDRHHEMLRRVWEEHCGIEVNTEGDSFFVAFHTVADGVAAAAAVQQAARSDGWPDGVTVRVGVHTGYAVPHHDDYQALAVHQCARVMSAAHGGQTFVTASTIALAGELPAGIRVAPLGRFRIRDFDEPVELLTAWVDGDDVRTTSPRVPPADGHNVVRPATSLIGRTAELTRLDRVASSGALVTLVGMGGVGKTRLALEHVLRAAPRWPEGAWFVPLASITSGDDMGSAIAEAIGAPTVGDADASRRVHDHLAGRRQLLVLDNCEHLLDETRSVVAGLRDAAPEVGILATSRQPLGMIGETVLTVEPLAADDVESPAVSLFVDRAAGEVTDLDTIRQLCTEVDGLPLGIELLAARSGLLGPSDILAVLCRSPGLIATDDPAVPERQRTLERLVRWSDDLLPDGARAMLRELTVVVGRFDLAMATALRGGDADTIDVLGHLLQLLDASLIRREQVPGETVYSLPMTVRRVIGSELGTHDVAALHRRLGHHFADRIGPRRATGPRWVDDVADHLDDIRHVINNLDDGVDDHALAQRLAWSIGRYHDVTGAFRDGVDELRRLVNTLGRTTPARVGLLSMLADLHLRIGGIDEATTCIAEAERLRTEVGVPDWDEVGVDRSAGEIALRRGDVHRAIEIAEGALAHGCDARGRVRLHNLRALAAHAMGDLTTARDALRIEIAEGEAAGLSTFTATSHGNLAELHLLAGDIEAAAEHQARCLELARAQRQRVLMAFSMIVAARLLTIDDRHEEGTRLHAAAIALLAATGYSLYPADQAAIDHDLERARRDLPVRSFEQAYTAGRALGPDDAADLAAGVLAAAAARRPAAITFPS